MGGAEQAPPAPASQSRSRQRVPAARHNHPAPSLLPSAGAHNPPSREPKQATGAFGRPSSVNGHFGSIRSRRRIERGWGRGRACGGSGRWSDGRHRGGSPDLLAGQSGRMVRSAPGGSAGGPSSPPALCPGPMTPHQPLTDAPGAGSASRPVRGVRNATDHTRPADRRTLLAVAASRIGLTFDDNGDFQSFRTTGRKHRPNVRHRPQSAWLSNGRPISDRRPVPHPVVANASRHVHRLRTPDRPDASPRRSPSTARAPRSPTGSRAASRAARSPYAPGRSAGCRCSRARRRRASFRPAIRAAGSA
jgi:hypothetical protein